MKNKILNQIPVILSLVFVITSCRSNQCSTIVTMKSGQIFKAIYVKSYVSGYSNIKICDGSNIQFKTSDIKDITEK